MHTCSCECIVYEKDEIYTMYISSGEKTDENCIICNNLKKADISKLQLELNKEYIPITYVIYDKNMSEKVSIVYNSFELNKDIQNEVF